MDENKSIKMKTVKRLSYAKLSYLYSVDIFVFWLLLLYLILA